MKMKPTPRPPYAALVSPPSLGAGLGLTAAAAVPFMLSSGATALKLSCDRFMLARYSSDSLYAAVSGGMTAYMAASLLVGLVAYTSVFVSQYHGAGLDRRIGLCVRQSLIFSLAAGLLLALLAPALAPAFSLLGHAPRLAELEGQYFSILTAGAVFSLLNTSLMAFFTGRGETWLVVLVNLGSIAANAALNGLLIFGAPGLCPALGIVGAGLATVASDAAKTAVLAALFLSPTNRRVYHTARGRLFEPRLFLKLARKGLDNGFQLFTGVSSMALFNLAAGQAAAPAGAAASGIAFSLVTAASIPAIGLGSAVAMLVGRAVGANDRDLARRNVRQAGRLAAGYGALVALIFLAWPPALIKLFGPGLAPAGRELAGELVGPAAVFFLAETAAMLYGGAIRGAGDSAYAMRVGAGAGALMAGLSLMVLGAGAPVRTLWGLAVLLTALKAWALYARYRKNDWLDHRLVEDDRRPKKIAAHKCSTMTTLLAALIFGLLGSARPALGQSEPGFRGETRVFGAMHTRIELKIPENSGSALSAPALADLAEAAVRKCDLLLSPFGEKSDIRRLNEAPVGEWVETDSLTMAVTLEALAWSRRTGGLFEPTIGPLKRLFRFEGQTLTSWPSAEALARAKAMVGADKLLTDAAGNRLARKVEGLVLDLGGIAKGYAADLAAEVLVSQGVRQALINVGGEMRVLGRNTGLTPPQPWLVGLADPLGRTSGYAVEIADRAVASSGNYESWFEHEGRRYSHILNPLTGLPLDDHLAGVTVIHPQSATAADALATFFSVAGTDGAVNFLKADGAGLFPQGLEVIMFVKEGEGLKTLHLKLDGSGELSLNRP
ncbi:MAG: FAD:protein FMN transferase [Candidatus Adiutrix sp.]|jgi:MATE family multidrug resistance protein|nr:FAD:protein FMN transferase [Candidatus Adiutrix sp.]